MNEILIFAMASILTIAASVGLPFCVTLAIVAIQKDQPGSRIGTVVVVLSEAIAIGFPIYVAAWFGDAQYAATLPPNTPRCGNNAMAAMLLIFPISPMFGSLGAGIGFVAAAICNASTIGGSPNPDDVR